MSIAVHALLREVFAKSNGIIVKVGDTSHPNGIEIVSCYPEWAERNERVLEELKDLLRNSSYENDTQRKLDYVI